MIDFIINYFSTTQHSVDDDWLIKTIAVICIYILILIVSGVVWLINKIRRKKWKK